MFLVTLCVNNLCRSPVYLFSAHDRSMQEVQLDQHVKLLDCPGIVMATGSSDTQIILRNAVKVYIFQHNNHCLHITVIRYLVL